MQVPDQSVFTSASRWVEQLLTGSLGVAIAGLGIASIGFAMLSGKIDVRRGLTVILGCFILFGAGIIAKGIIGTSESNIATSAPRSMPPNYPTPQRTEQRPKSEPYDPYAGAAVPQSVDPYAGTTLPVKNLQQ